MIRINLVRGKRKKRREVDVGFLYLLVPLLVVAGLFFYHRTLTGRIETVRNNIARAEAEVARLKKEIGEVERFKARKAELQQKVDVISSLQAGRSAPAKLFQAIAEAIPEKCWIDRLSVKDGKVELSGVALNNHTIANFMTSLSAGGRFRDVVLGSAEQTTTMNLKLVKFSLTFQAVN